MQKYEYQVLNCNYYHYTGHLKKRKVNNFMKNHLKPPINNWSPPKISGIILKDVQDSRSQDPACIEALVKTDLLVLNVGKHCHFSPKCPFTAYI